MAAKRSVLIGRLKSYVSQKLLVEGGADSDQAEAYLEQLRDSSDRVSTLIASMLVDDALRIGLSNYIIQDRDRMFADRGLLSSFDSRIRFAHGLGMIDDKARDDLDLIREVRNAAAHAMLEFSFEDPAIANVCELFYALNAKQSALYDDAAETAKSEAGLKYLTTCLYYFQAIADTGAQKPISPESYPWP